MLSWDLPEKFLLETALAPWACLSVVFISTAVTKWSNSYKKTLMTQSVILITRYKSGTILFWDYACQIFSKKMPLSNYLWCPMMNKKNHLFLYSTYQDCMIFAKIGDGSCWYLWNEICAGVVLEKNIKMHSKNWASMVFLFWMNGRSHVFFELSSTLMFFWPICISSILNQDWSKFSHSATLILL